MPNANERSKFLSYILRHQPEAVKIKLSKEGWASIDDIVANAGFTREEIQSIVDADKKIRYAISDDGNQIRANQGHSTSQVKMSFAKGIPPTTLYHGTTSDVVPSILNIGIRPMNRHHVHLSADRATATEVGGRRKTGLAILSINAKKMLADGVTFYLSENGVWLVDFVDPKYVSLLKA